MVHVSGQAFGSLIDNGKVYYFKSNKLKGTHLPHYFIVVAIPSEDLIIFTAGTTQFEKRKRFIELHSIPYSTLVWIKPDSENGLHKDTYVDCNSYFQYSRSELIQMYELHQIDFVGQIRNSKLEEIRTGLNESPLIPAEIKEKFK